MKIFSHGSTVVCYAETFQATIVDGDVIYDPNNGSAIYVCWEGHLYYSSLNRGKHGPVSDEILENVFIMLRDKNLTKRNAFDNFRHLHRCASGEIA